MRKIPLGILALTAVLVLTTAPLYAQEQWLPRTSGTTAHLWGVAYGDNQWVAVGEKGTILTSPDGVIWTKRPIPKAYADGWLTAVTYANHLWVAVGDAATPILTSTDGVSWTPRTLPGIRLNAVAYGNGIFVAHGNSDYILSSIYLLSGDGTTWHMRSNGAVSTSRGFAYGAPYLVSVATETYTPYLSTFIIESSPDVVFEISPRPSSIDSIVNGRNEFIAVSKDGRTYSSRDGISWTQRAATNLAVNGLTFFNNQLVAVGTARSKGRGVATSFDGSAWIERSTGLESGAILLAASAGVSSVVAVGKDGTILQSAAARVAPSVVDPPKSVVEALGGNVAFTVGASGSLPLSYQWKLNGAPITGATDATLFLPSVKVTQSGEYACVITNPVGTTTATANLAVRSSLPEPQPIDPSFTLGPALSQPPRTALSQSDGKILLGGDFTLLNENQPQRGLARLNVDGSLDITFKPGSIDATGKVDSLAVQPDGKILVGGSFTSLNGTPRKYLARLHPDGSLDSTFVAVIRSGGSVIQIAVAPDGRILVNSGSTTLYRLKSDGSADPTWKEIRIVLGVRNSIVFTAKTQPFGIQPDGKIILAMSGTPSDTTTFPITSVIRLDVDGSIDTSFTDVSISEDSVSALRVHGDGRFVVASMFWDIVVRRYSADGQLEGEVRQLPATTAAFTRDGFTWLGLRSVSSVTNILGVVRNQLARLNANGTLDLTFDAGSVLQNAAGVPATTTSILPLDDNRAIIIGRYAGSNGPAQPFIVRVNAQSLGGNAPVIVGSTPKYVELPAGAPLTVAINATGSAPLTYTASTSQGTFTGNQYSIPAGSIVADGLFTISVGNKFGTAQSQSFFVRLAPAITAAPGIQAPPQALQTNVGRAINLSASFDTTSGVSYQWFKGGVAIPGATNGNYFVAQAATKDTGDYVILAQNSAGSVASPPVHVGVDETARIVNFATRGNVGAGDANLIVGFITAGPGNKRLLLRAVGPTLGAFGVPGTLADPVLRLFDSSGTLVYTNDDWSQSNNPIDVRAADSRTGAFRLADNSADAAELLTLAPGAYSAVISGKNINGRADTGVALAEIYEDDTSSGRLVNLSARGVVSPEAGVMIPAVVTGPSIAGTAKKLLFRGIGPGLANFGISNALADPTIRVVDGSGRTVATNDNWENNPNLAELRAVTAQLAFPLAAGSKDAAVLVALPPGSYTCVVSSVNNTTGTALVEVYEVP